MGRDLAQRVQANATQRQGSNGGSAETIEQSIQRMEQQFALAMPRGAEATQLVRDAITCLRMTPRLAQCDRASVLGSLMTCAQLGLRPGVLGHAWLLPFYDRRANDGRGGLVAQLVIGYQGLVELAHRSGRIASLIARTVCEGDTFDVDYGLADTLVHKPQLFGDRGEPIAYYAIAKFTTGGHAFFVMSHTDMCRYRDAFATAKTKTGEVVGPWRDNFEGMAHKTCVRQLAKWMPKSTELATALEADNSVRLDISPDAPSAATFHHPDAGYLEGEVVEPQQPPADADGVTVEDPPDDGWPETPEPGSEQAQATATQRTRSKR